MRWVADKTDKLYYRKKNLLISKSPKILIVLQANKLARILWLVLAQDVVYKSND